MDERAAQSRRGRPPTSDDTRRRQRLEISRVAVALFRSHGLAGTSGVDIASAAGVSERTLWRLFRSKVACVEPVLTQALDGFRAVLRSWSPDTGLAEHLRSAYRFVPDDVRADTESVLAVVRMSQDVPELRAVWLVLQERTEPTIAAVLAPQLGLPPGSAQVRVRAATANAALRVLTDDLARATADGVTALDVEAHRLGLAETLQASMGAPAPTP